ncbi:MAG: VOC family protein [Bacteroidota bacterium]
MSDDFKPEMGAITWADLTVKDADTVSAFYSAVVGWKPEPVKMGDYSDYNMTIPGTGQPAAGVCHARGVNAGLPSQWLLYITVPDLTASINKCKELGGKVIVEPKSMGEMGRYGVIEDPAGAVVALFEPKG